jgi:chromosome segregation ATPase
VNGLEWTGVLTASALLITALAAGAPRILRAIADAIPRLTTAATAFANSWRSRAKAQEVTAETVRGIVESMRLSLEKRIAEGVDERGELARRLALIEGEHSKCTKALGEMRDENQTLRDKVERLEEIVRSQGDKIAKYESLLDAAATERDELQRAIEAGGGAVLRALPAPTKDHPIDVVRGRRSRKDG